MEKEKLAFFEERLLAEKGRLLAQIERMESDIRDNTSDQSAEGAESEDVASDVFDMECILAERKVLEFTLKDINKALERMANGTYGYSEISGKPIPEDRLEAIPWANRLVEEEPGMALSGLRGVSR